MRNRAILRPVLVLLGFFVVLGWGRAGTESGQRNGNVEVSPVYSVLVRLEFEQGFRPDGGMYIKHLIITSEIKNVRLRRSLRPTSDQAPVPFAMEANEARGQLTDFEFQPVALEDGKLQKPRLLDPPQREFPVLLGILPGFRGQTLPPSMAFSGDPLDEGLTVPLIFRTRAGGAILRWGCDLGSCEHYDERLAFSVFWKRLMAGKQFELTLPHADSDSKGGWTITFIPKKILTGR